MSKKLNAMQEKFCQLVTEGMPAYQAYSKAGYKAKGAAARSNSSNLVTNQNIVDRLEELRAKSASNSVKTAQEVKEGLSRLMDSAEKEGDYSGFTQLSNRLAKMEGHDEPDKVQISTVGSVLEMMRKGDE